MVLDKILTGGFLAGKKTILASLLGIVSAVVAYLVGDADLTTTFNSVFTFLTAIFLRQGIATQSKDNS